MSLNFFLLTIFPVWNNSSLCKIDLKINSLWAIINTLHWNYAFIALFIPVPLSTQQKQYI